MTYKITVKQDKIDNQLDDVEQWLHNNAGTGSARYSGREEYVNHWLNGEDWLYYQMVPADVDLEKVYIFVFKNEQVATEFALRFA